MWINRCLLFHGFILQFENQVTDKGQSRSEWNEKSVDFKSFHYIHFMHKFLSFDSFNFLLFLLNLIARNWSGRVFAEIEENSTISKRCARRKPFNGLKEKRTWHKNLNVCYLSSSCSGENRSKNGKQNKETFLGKESLYLTKSEKDVLVLSQLLPYNLFSIENFQSSSKYF